jgi:repressor LexA
MAHTPPGQTRRKVYRFMRERLLAGSPPTIREVQHAFGFRSPESARSQLEALVREGMLIKEPGRSRGYRLPGGPGVGGRAGEKSGVALVPLLGRVQAGDLTTAIEEPEGYLAIDGRPTSERLFALRVRGESMTGAGILPDDVVIVRQQDTARAGEVVVALVEDEATVKTLRRRGRRVVLQPENPAFSPIELDPETVRERGVRVLGKVVEVRRYLEVLPILESSELQAAGSSAEGEA